MKKKTTRTSTKKSTTKASTKKSTAKKSTKTATAKTTTAKTTRKRTTKTTEKKPTTTRKTTTSKAKKAPSKRETVRTQKVDAEKVASREFYRRNRKSDSKRSLRIAKAGKRRILRANKRAEAVEIIGNIVARRQAAKGKYMSARKTSRKSIERSDRIIQKAITKNSKLYGKFERKRFIKELVDVTTAEINEEYVKDAENSSKWNEKNEDSKIAKIINGFGKVDISVKRFTAKADMGVASLYARAANFMGFSDHAKSVIEEAAMAAEERVRYSRVDNEKTRVTADRVFGFAERRRKNLESAEIFIDNLGRDVISGISEGWNHLNDDLATWIADIDSRRGQPIGQRNYSLAFAGGGYVSNSFQARSRNVLNFVEGSLTGNQRGNTISPIYQKNNDLGKQNSREDR